MATWYRKVYSHTWDDEKFVRLGPVEKLIAVNILTGQTNRIGCFRFSPALAAEQTGLDGEPSGNVGGNVPPNVSGAVPGPVPTFRERVALVCSTLGWQWDQAARVIYIPTWWKYNPPENRNVFVGALADAVGLPQTPLVKEFWANARHLSPALAAVLAERSPNVPRTLPEPPPKPSPIQEQEQDLNTPLTPQRGHGSPSASKAKREPRRKKPAPDDHPLFARFWDAYPRHTKRERAVQAFARLDPDEPLLARMLAALGWQSRSDDWTKDGGRYVPHPSTWLSDKRWQDEPAGRVAALGTGPPARKSATVEDLRAAGLI